MELVYRGEWFDHTAESCTLDIGSYCAYVYRLHGDAQFQWWVRYAFPDADEGGTTEIRRGKADDKVSAVQATEGAIREHHAKERE